MIAYCAHAANGGAFILGGDSGGPVWRTGPSGVLAVGIVVSNNPVSGDGCFYPIQRLLDNWGAWLPTFSGARASEVPQSTRVTPAPRIKADDFQPAIRQPR